MTNYVFEWAEIVPKLKKDAILDKSESHSVEETSRISFDVKK